MQNDTININVESINYKITNICKLHKRLKEKNEQTIRNKYLKIEKNHKSLNSINPQRKISKIIEKKNNISV